MKLGYFALTALLALVCACNSERPSATTATDATKARSPASADELQRASVAQRLDPETHPDDTIPASFQGRWAADADACRKPADESQLELQADRAAFFEGSGPIKSVVVDGDVVTLVAELTAEGETDETTYAFRLSDNGNTLTDISTGPGMVRHRC